MVRVIKIAALVLMCALAIPVCAQEEAMDVYESNRFGDMSFSFEYPALLELIELSPNAVAVLLEYRPVPSFSVSVQDMRDWGRVFNTLDEYMEQYDKRKITN